MSDYWKYIGQNEMLRNMSGMDLYQIIVNMPRSSGFLHDLDKSLQALLEAKYNAGTLEEQRVKHFSVDREQRKAEQLADMAADHDVTEEEMERFLKDIGQWD